jgi:hypothetical protein
MTEPRDGSAQDRALWQRWSTMDKAPKAEGPGGAARPDAMIPDAMIPDAMILAEFAENRLSDPDATSIAAFLDANPLISQDVAVASRAVEIAPRPGDAALAAVIARAVSLAPAQGGERRADTVVPFRAARPAGAPWPIAARWGALAASLALVSWLGFSLGSDAYGDLAALDGQGGTRLADELLDPPSGFFGLVDQSGT